MIGLAALLKEIGGEAKAGPVKASANANANAQTSDFMALLLTLVALASGAERTFAAHLCSSIPLRPNGLPSMSSNRHGLTECT